MIIRLSVLLLMCTCMLGAQAFYYTVGQDMECDTVLHSMDVDRTAAQFQPLISGLTKSKLLVLGQSGCFSKYQGFVMRYQMTDGSPGIATVLSQWFLRTDSFTNSIDLQYITDARFDEANKNESAYQADAYTALAHYQKDGVQHYQLLFFLKNSANLQRAVLLDSGYKYQHNTIMLKAVMLADRSQVMSYKIFMQHAFTSNQTNDNLRIDKLSFTSNSVIRQTLTSSNTGPSLRFTLTKLRFIAIQWYATNSKKVGAIGQIWDNQAGGLSSLVMVLDEATMSVENATKLPIMPNTVDWTAVQYHADLVHGKISLFGSSRNRVTFEPIATNLEITRMVLMSDLTEPFTSNINPFISCNQSFVVKQIRYPASAPTHFQIYDYQGKYGGVSMLSGPGTFHDSTLGPYYTFDSSNPVIKLYLAIGTGSPNTCDSQMNIGSSLFRIYDGLPINTLPCQSGTCKIVYLSQKSETNLYAGMTSTHDAINLPINANKNVVVLAWATDTVSAFTLSVNNASLTQSQGWFGTNETLTSLITSLPIAETLDPCEKDPSFIITETANRLQTQLDKCYASGQALIYDIIGINIDEPWCQYTYSYHSTYSFLSLSGSITATMSDCAPETNCLKRLSFSAPYGAKLKHKFYIRIQYGAGGALTKMFNSQEVTIRQGCEGSLAQKKALEGHIAYKYNDGFLMSKELQVSTLISEYLEELSPIVCPIVSYLLPQPYPTGVTLTDGLIASQAKLKFTLGPLEQKNFQMDVGVPCFNNLEQLNLTLTVCPGITLLNSTWMNRALPLDRKEHLISFSEFKDKFNWKTSGQVKYELVAIDGSPLNISAIKLALNNDITIRADEKLQLSFLIKPAYSEFKSACESVFPSLNLALRVDVKIYNNQPTFLQPLKNIYISSMMIALQTEEFEIQRSSITVDPEGDEFSIKIIGPEALTCGCFRSHINEDFSVSFWVDPLKLNTSQHNGVYSLSVSLDDGKGDAPTVNQIAISININETAVNEFKKKAADQEKAEAEASINMTSETTLGCKAQSVKAIKSQIEFNLTINDGKDLLVPIKDLKNLFTSSDELNCPVRNLEVLEQSLKPIQNSETMFWDQNSGLTIKNSKYLQMEILLFQVRVSIDQKKSATAALVVKFLAPSVNQPPFIKERLNNLVIDQNLLDLKPEELFYESPKAQDIEKNAISIFIRGLEKVPCQCLSSKDLGDGRFQIKIDYKKIDSQSDGLYFLQATYIDDVSDGLNTETFILSINLRKGAVNPSQADIEKFILAHWQSQLECQDPIFVSYKLKLDFDGVLEIKFNQTMIDQFNGFDLKDLNSKNLMFQLQLDDVESATGHRRLVNISEWEPLFFQKNRILLQFGFNYPEEISPYRNQNEDRLVMDVFNPRLFKVKKNCFNTIISHPYRHKKILLKRQVKSRDRQLIKTFGENASIAMYGVIISYFVVSNFLSIGMQYLFTVMNALNVVFLMSLARLEFPANASFLNNILIQVMIFDIIDPYEVLDFIGYDYEKDFEMIQQLEKKGIAYPITRQMEDMEVQTFNPVTNIGGVFMLLALYLGQVLVTSLIFGLIRIAKKVCGSRKTSPMSEGGGRVNLTDREILPRNAITINEEDKRNLTDRVRKASILVRKSLKNQVHKMQEIQRMREALNIDATHRMSKERRQSVILKSLSQIRLSVRQQRQSIADFRRSTALTIETNVEMTKMALKYSIRTCDLRTICISLVYFARASLESVWMSLYWTQLITIVYESVFHCTLSLILFIESFRYFDSDDWQLSNVFTYRSIIIKVVLALISLTLLGIFMVTFVLIITPQEKVLKRYKKHRFGILVDNLNLSTYFQRANSFLFAIRRVLFAVYFVYLDYLGETIVIILILDNLFFFLCTALSEPMLIQSENRRLMLNDAVILFLTDSLVIFTSYCDNELARYNIGGWLFCGILCLFISVNLVIMIYNILSKLLFATWRKLKKCSKKQDEYEESDSESSSESSSSNSKCSHSDEEADSLRELKRQPGKPPVNILQIRLPTVKEMSESESDDGEWDIYKKKEPVKKKNINLPDNFFDDSYDKTDVKPAPIKKAIKRRQSKSARGLAIDLKGLGNAKISTKSSPKVNSKNPTKFDRDDYDNDLEWIDTNKAPTQLEKKRQRRQSKSARGIQMDIQAFQQKEVTQRQTPGLASIVYLELSKWSENQKIWESYSQMLEQLRPSKSKPNSSVPSFIKDLAFIKVRVRDHYLDIKTSLKLQNKLVDKNSVVKNVSELKKLVISQNKMAYKVQTTFWDTVPAAIRYCGTNQNFAFDEIEFIEKLSEMDKKLRQQKDFLYNSITKKNKILE